MIEAGYYKPNPHVYNMALEKLGQRAENVLFVAGSSSDVTGAARVGMSVYWHNRIGLKEMDDGIQPLFTSDSLDQLLEIV